MVDANVTLTKDGVAFYSDQTSTCTEFSVLPVA